MQIRSGQLGLTREYENLRRPVAREVLCPPTVVESGSRDCATRCERDEQERHATRDGCGCPVASQDIGDLKAENARQSLARWRPGPDLGHHGSRKLRED